MLAWRAPLTSGIFSPSRRPTVIQSSIASITLSLGARLEEMVQDARLRHLQVEVTTFQSGEKFSRETAP